MAHHIVTEDDLHKICIYCKTDVNFSKENVKPCISFDGEKKYLRCVCPNCKRDLDMNITIETSGDLEGLVKN